MARFHDIKIKSISPETPHAKVITFDIPAQLLSDFNYVPGQYITIEVEVNGNKERRAYSLCSSPVSDSLPSVGVKKVEFGKVSTYLNDVAQAGQTVRLMEPMGNFKYVTDAANRNHLVLYAGGSGITPMMAITKSLLQQEPNSQITLFYANRNTESIMFKNVLDDLAIRYSNFKVVYTLDNAEAGWNGKVGYLDKAMTESLLNEYIGAELANVKHYMCGPGPMMDQIDDALIAKGVAKDKIHREFFTASTKKDDVDVEVTGGTVTVSDAPLDEAEMTITVDGDEHNIKYTGQMSVLDAALDNDLDAPFACQVGACCTCRAKLHEGKVHMEDRESLSDEEIEEGYILTCQSKPLTSKLVFSYDE